MRYFTVIEFSFKFTPLKSIQTTARSLGSYSGMRLGFCCGCSCSWDGVRVEV